MFNKYKTGGQSPKMKKQQSFEDKQYQFSFSTEAHSKYGESTSFKENITSFDDNSLKNQGYGYGKCHEYDSHSNTFSHPFQKYGGTVRLATPTSLKDINYPEQPSMKKINSLFNHESIR